MDDHQYKETHVWGPPGCGKTTYNARQVHLAARKFGDDKVLVTSYTKAAALTLASRILSIPEQNLGTLHSICFRALDHPDLAECHLDMWNKEHPEFRLSLRTEDLENVVEPEFTMHTTADELYGQLNILRARMQPPDRRPPSVGRFESVWDPWKQAHGFMDFTDLLENGLRDFKSAPGDPSVIIVDEAQDLTRLQLALVRQWGSHAEHLVLAGDDDQTVYSFAGADPHALTENAPEYFRQVLSQSYRLPRQVYALVEAWIRQLSRRQPKDYNPRDAEGEVRMFHNGSYRYPEPIVDDAERYLAQNKRVMFLAACSFMLEPLKHVLRRRGLPFWNPYRPERSDWNPLNWSPEGNHLTQNPEYHQNENQLRQSLKRGLPPFELLLAFLGPWIPRHPSSWNADELRLWTEWLSPNVLRAGARERFDKSGSIGAEAVRAITEILEIHHAEGLSLALSQHDIPGGVTWWLDHLLAKKRRAADYPAKVALRHGAGALTAAPQLIIGTGHSVKGGEADVVYVFPDLSPSGARQWESSPTRDAIIRLAYVMITRARESLILCAPAGHCYLPLEACVTKLKRRG